jgi:tetratricopeptide (TPR) repeat protein
MVAAVIVLRRKMPHAPRPYRTWGYPLVPLIYITLATLLILDIGYLAPATSGIGYLIVLTGIPVYLAWRGRAASVTGAKVLLVAASICFVPVAGRGHEPAKYNEGGISAGISQRWRGYESEGALAMSIKDWTRAIRYFTNALDQGPPPDVAIDLYRLRGSAHLEKGERDKAAADFARVLRFPAKNAPDFRIRGDANVAIGNYKAAAADYARAAELASDDARSLNDLAWLRATCPDASQRNGQEAVRLATRACELSKWRDYDLIDTLAAAHAEAGNFELAVKQQEVVLKKVGKRGGDGLEQRRALYRQRKPYRDLKMGRPR